MKCNEFARHVQRKLQIFAVCDNKYPGGSSIAVPKAERSLSETGSVSVLTDWSGFDSPCLWSWVSPGRTQTRSVWCWTAVWLENKPVLSQPFVFPFFLHENHTDHSLSLISPRIVRLSCQILSLLLFLRLRLAFLVCLSLSPLLSVN